MEEIIKLCNESLALLAIELNRFIKIFEEKYDCDWNNVKDPEDEVHQLPYINAGIARYSSVRDYLERGYLGPDFFHEVGSNLKAIRNSVQIDDSRVIAVEKEMRTEVSKRLRLSRVIYDNLDKKIKELQKAKKALDKAICEKDGFDEYYQFLPSDNSDMQVTL